MSSPRLFTPWQMRRVVARNRVAISPMQQYSAEQGEANDWHLAHLARFAMGGAGIVFVGSTAVEERGRNTHGDLGLWAERHVEPLGRVARALRRSGAVAGIQLGHCGRKAGLQKWWEGHGPLGAKDVARGEGPWPTIGPSPLPVDDHYRVPEAPDTDGVAQTVQAWGEAARRARDAGLRGTGDPWRPWLPDPPVPASGIEPAQRPVRPAALDLCAGGGRRGAPPLAGSSAAVLAPYTGLPRGWRVCAGREHRLRACAARSRCRRAGLLLRWWHLRLPGRREARAPWPGLPCRCRCGIAPVRPAWPSWAWA
jgi:hypothetical protein